VAKSDKSSDAFVQAVEQALEKCNDAEWLGAHSPLAAPYFIGTLLDQAPAKADAGAATHAPARRGQALSAALRRAAAEVNDAQARVLSASFFQRKPTLNNTGVARELGMAEATYYRHRASAIEALARAFNQLVVPPLRAELPRVRHIVGRQVIINACFDALSQRHSVALTGRSGMGKTTIGSALAERWGRERAFWFTVRPGLNDSLSAFAFSLSYFLRGLGASNAWRQLAADHGTVNAERILGLIRHDLAELPDQPILICIDDSDQLRPEMRAHGQVIQFVEALGQMTPVLSLSQQPLFDAEQQFVLSGFSAEETTQLLALEGVIASEAEIRELHEATRGHPLLIKLSAMLLREGEVARQLSGERSAQALFTRIWKRLSDEERAVLLALAVYRSPAPLDVWQSYSAALERLLRAELAQADGLGGVSVAAHMREFVRERIVPDALPALHLHAAAVREARGEYASAVHHYARAEQPALAVWLWFNHRAHELDKGHGPAARETFRSVRQSDLPNADDRRALAVIRSELALRLGEAEEAEAELTSKAWPTGDALTPLARELMGDAMQMQGRVEQALAQYRIGLEAMRDAYPRQAERLHAKIGHVYASRLRDLDHAREEALMALSHAFNFRGVVEEEAGNYAEALRNYEAALALASDMRGGAAARAITQSHLGPLFMRLGDADQAIANLTQSRDYARKAGEPVNGLYDALNLSSAYVVTGRYEEALALAQESLESAEAMKHTFLAASLAASAAEACLRLNKLDEAERFAYRSLREEEESHRPYVLTTLGGVAQARGDTAQAERLFSEAIESAQGASDRYAEAHAWLALAHAREVANAATAREAWSHALTLSEQLGLTAEAQQARERLMRLESQP
jgi:tetratricopeptide (TPR) repeat protein